MLVKTHRNHRVAYWYINFAITPAQLQVQFPSLQINWPYLLCVFFFLSASFIPTQPFHLSKAYAKEWLMTHRKPKASETKRLGKLLLATSSITPTWLWLCRARVVRLRGRERRIERQERSDQTKEKQV